MNAGKLFYRVEIALKVHPNLDVSYKGHQAYQIKIEPAVYRTRTDNSGAYARTSSIYAISIDDLMQGVKPKPILGGVDKNGEPTAVSVSEFLAEQNKGKRQYSISSAIGYTIRRKWSIV